MIASTALTNTRYLRARFSERLLRRHQPCDAERAALAMHRVITTAGAGSRRTRFDNITINTGLERVLVHYRISIGLIYPRQRVKASSSNRTGERHRASNDMRPNRRPHHHHRVLLRICPKLSLPSCDLGSGFLKSFNAFISNSIEHHHQPMNVPTAGAQAYHHASDHLNNCLTSNQIRHIFAPTTARLNVFESIQISHLVPSNSTYGRQHNIELGSHFTL